MKRITERNGADIGLICAACPEKECRYGPYDWHCAEIIAQLLAEYEDTGLTPAQVEALKGVLRQCAELLRALRTYPQIKLAHAVIDNLLAEIERIKDEDTIPGNSEAFQ